MRTGTLDDTGDAFPGGGLVPRWERVQAAAARLQPQAGDGDGDSVEEILRWLSERREAGGFRVDRIAFDELDGWGFREDTGDLAHRSGRFFTVQGLHVTGDTTVPREWYQPIINQPEVGILGILTKEFEGVPHFLMQAKMEPGNPNMVQLSPTVQATRSNYTGAHGGRKVRYLDYFVEPGRARVLADVLQSEHGSWFYRKNNRNMLVEVAADSVVPEHEDFRWIGLGQLARLLRHDNTVNMDARTVLACAPTADPDPYALRTDTDLLSWFTGERSRHQITSETVPLASIPDWTRSADRISHDRGQYFDVVAVAVEAGAREVASWSQPLIRPHGPGVTAFITKRFGDVPHLLVHARVEGGFLDTVELGPTVQCTPENHAHLPSEDRPAFLELVRSAAPEHIRYEAVHSEEGGRFLEAESRYLVVDADDGRLASDPPPGYCWATPGQLNALLRHGNYVNVQARTLLACINTGAVRL